MICVSIKEWFYRIIRSFYSIRDKQMMESVSHLNCCSTPKLYTIKTVYEASHDAEWLQQCRKCKTYWFKRFYEWIDWNGGDDEITTWYTKLTENEARNIIQAKKRNELDLSYLKDRETIMDDRGSIKITKGQPTSPSR